VVAPAGGEGSGGEGSERRDYDVEHYARVLRDTFAARLARALSPDDFAEVFADADQLSLFAPSTATMRPVLEALATSGAPPSP
jgi:DNA polymerase, archaea type